MHKQDFALVVVIAILMICLSCLGWAGNAKAIDMTRDVGATLAEMIDFTYTPQDGVGADAQKIPIGNLSISQPEGYNVGHIDIASNSGTGYNVNLRMYNNDAKLNYLTNSTHSVCSAGTCTNAIGPVASSSALTSNTWGWFMGTGSGSSWSYGSPASATWNPVPVANGTPAPLLNTNGAGVTTGMPIIFGARINATLPANNNAVYSNYVLFTATNNV